ncbi:MAG: TonB-dependent receptor, partial [Bacteroidetes bacterium]
YSNIDTIFNADGISGNTLIGKRSEYIVENRMNENSQLWFNSVYNKFINDNLQITAGIQHRRYNARHYKTLVDLLGGDYVVDIDKYAERDLVGEGVADNDISYPNHIVDSIGEVFGNDYNAHVNKTQLWANAGYNFGKVDVYFGLEGSNTNFWRTGNMQNGKFPDNSLGNSEKLHFYNYGIKAGATYKLSGMHFFHLDGANLTKAPDFRNSFVSPRTRNQIVDGLENEQILSVQGGYILQSNKLKATVDLYYTQFKNQTEARSFYFDGFNNFVNFVMTGINKTHQGIEIGTEYTITPGLSVFGVANLGYYRWTSRPEFSVYVDNSAEVFYDKETVYVEGFLVSGTPQTAFSGGVKYWAPKHWWIGLSGNYMDDTYLSFSALTRTVNAVKYSDHTTQEYLDLINQDKLPTYYTLDGFVGKSFRFQYKYNLNISLNVSNILNNESIVTGGYEQARLDLSDYNKFEPKKYYYSGLQYYLNVSFRF